MPKPVPPAADCDAIDRILISLADDHPVSLVKSDLELFKFSQFQLGYLHGSASGVHAVCFIDPI